MLDLQLQAEYLSRLARALFELEMHPEHNASLLTPHVSVLALRGMENVYHSADIFVR
jgi:hypothetical protein